MSFSYTQTNCNPHERGGLFLSRLIFDRLGPQANCHKLVMQGFPHVEAEDARANLGILFRVEMVEGHRAILVQSKIEPDWSRLTPNPQVKQWTPHVESGDQLIVKMTINPVLKDGETKKRRVVSAQRWLQSRNLGGEFKVESVQSSQIAAASGQHKFPVAQKTLIGRMTVTSADVFLGLVYNGCGRAKAYGCGLVSFVKLENSGN